jgi:hypothetical protein
MKKENAIKAALIALLCVLVFLITFTVVTNSSSDMASASYSELGESIPTLLSQAAQSGTLDGGVMYGCDFKEPAIVELTDNYIVFYGRVDNCSKGSRYVGCAVKTHLVRDYEIDLDNVLFLEEDTYQALITDTTMPFVRAKIYIDDSQGGKPQLSLTTGVNPSDVISCVIVFVCCFWFFDKKLTQRQMKKAAKEAENAPPVKE